MSNTWRRAPEIHPQSSCQTRPALMWTAAGTSCWRQTLSQWLVELQGGWRLVSLASMFSRGRWQHHSGWCDIDIDIDWHWGDAFSRWLSSRLGMIWEFWAVKMPQLATLLFSGAKLLKEDFNKYFLHSGTPTQEWQDWHTWTTMNPRTFWCSRERLVIKIYPTPSLTWLVIFILSVYWG